MSTNEPMTRQQLDAIQARLDATTEGPWEQCGRGIDGGPSSLTEVVTLDVECMGHCYGGTGLGVQNEADAGFIAHARTDVPALLAEVERLRARLTVDDAMVERAARVLNEEDETPGTLSWDNESEMNRRSYRRMARAALDAALGTGEVA